MHTLNNSQQNNDDKEEEGDIKHDPVNFVIIPIGRFDFITDTTTRSHTLIKMEDEALQ